MKKSREFVNRYTTIPLMLMLGVVILFSFSCDTIDDEDFDKLLQPEETTDTVPSVATETEPQVPADEPIGLETLTFTIDATNREGWHGYCACPATGLKECRGIKLLKPNLFLFAS